MLLSEIEHVESNCLETKIMILIQDHWILNDTDILK